MVSVAGEMVKLKIDHGSERNVHTWRDVQDREVW